MRRLLAPYFTADQVQNRTKMIVQRARLFLEALIGREAFDLINEFSLPLVSLLGCEWLGVKTEKLDVFYRSMRAGPTWEKLQAAMTGTGLLAELHTGGKISTRELLEWYCFIYSGPVAVSDFIANAIYILLEQPVWLEQARAQPDVIPALVEELLRLAPPVLHVRRRVLKAVNIAGIELPAGALLYLAIASANRDPDKFERPAELILHRSGPTHLSFGAGSHDCMGRHWGRVEAEILLRLLLVEYPPLRAVQPLNDIEFIGGPHIHLPREMHVSFAPTSV
jgi:cytochrome P450